MLADAAVAWLAQVAGGLPHWACHSTWAALSPSLWVALHDVAEPGVCCLPPPLPAWLQVAGKAALGDAGLAWEGPEIKDLDRQRCGILIGVCGAVGPAG